LKTRKPKTKQINGIKIRESMVPGDRHVILVSEDGDIAIPFKDVGKVAYKLIHWACWLEEQKRDPNII